MITHNHYLPYSAQEQALSDFTGIEAEYEIEDLETDFGTLNKVTLGLSGTDEAGYIVTDVSVEGFAHRIYVNPQHTMHAGSRFGQIKRLALWYTEFQLHVLNAVARELDTRAHEEAIHRILSL